MKIHKEPVGAESLGHGSSAERDAAEVYVQRFSGDWTKAMQMELEGRLECDRAFADAWRRVDASWCALDRYSESPELMAYRAEAISDLRIRGARRWWRPSAMKWWRTRWRIAAALLGVVVSAVAWQLTGKARHPGEFRTDIGEQRLIELGDHSRITMDAATQLIVEFTGESRTVRLLAGQAQFSVAKDPARPFKVVAGSRTVVAVGTVFTVEYVDQNVHVAMLEGRVAVIADSAAGSRRQSPARDAMGVSGAPSGRRDASLAVSDTGGSIGGKIIELDAGEELRVAYDGQPVVTREADLEAATAWREGKVIFRTEPLAEAVERMNRYSRLRLVTDEPAIAAMRVSGVFEAGDTRGFVDALERNFPVTADYAADNTVRLKSR